MLRKLTFLILFNLLLPSLIWAVNHPTEPFQAKVVGIIDGDTLDVLYQKSQIRVRLYGVDCPEKSQAFGTKAKQETSSLVFGHIVTVVPLKQETYNRIVAHIKREDGAELSTELVRKGMCWWYEKYAPKDLELKALEAAAKKGKIGLFQDPHAIPPSEFRHPKKKIEKVVGEGYYWSPKTPPFTKPEQISTN